VALGSPFLIDCEPQNRNGIKTSSYSSFTVHKDVFHIATVSGRRLFNDGTFRLFSQLDFLPEFNLLAVWHASCALNLTEHAPRRLTSQAYVRVSDQIIEGRK